MRLVIFLMGIPPAFGGFWDCVLGLLNEDRCTFSVFLSAFFNLPVIFFIFLFFIWLYRMAMPVLVVFLVISY